ncbi:hypothetical protein [Pseudomonas sp. Leaf58]|uniref:hypothetical protein n=1 Tax=Pseudomonas sp. Leaf58 TaxID=1736226 RepID=UPI000A416F27|nr:hypothetical protein [Pseudomonas sp. Leaf58]
MTTLTLALKGEYFDAILAGTKQEEYRLVTPYWRKRLEGRDYSCIELTRGYPRRDDASRRLRLPWKGFRVITLTHPHFGAEPVTVFAINVQSEALAAPQSQGATTATSSPAGKAVLEHADCPGGHMHSLHHYAIFQRPEAFGQGIRLLGFTRDTPSDEALAESGHLALALDTTLASEVAAQYALEAPERRQALAHSPRALIIEGSLWETGVTAYGPFLNAQEAHLHTWKLGSIHRTMIISLEQPQRELRVQRAVNIVRLREESALYHGVMQDLYDIKRPHGKCQPRADKACTHCNAQDRLDNALAEYPGPRVVCS